MKTLLTIAQATASLLIAFVLFKTVNAVVGFPYVLTLAAAIAVLVMTFGHESEAK